jgi:hypothetical protein
MKLSEILWGIWAIEMWAIALFIWWKIWALGRKNT